MKLGSDVLATMSGARRGDVRGVVVGAGTWVASCRATGTGTTKAGP